MKNKLNNLLSFKDFDKLPNNQKKTKRSDTGLDILNENFYDKLAFIVSNSRPLDNALNEFKNKIIKAAISGQVTELNINGDIYSFKILNREFTIDADSDTVQMNTPISDNIKFDLLPAMTSEITDSLDDIEY